MRNIIVNIARFIVSVTFILSGFVKAVDPVGTQYKIADYLAVLHLGQYIPDFMTLFVSVLLSAAEFWLGVCLLFAIRRRVVTRCILGWLLILTPLTLWLAISNPISDCGCFGDAVVLTNWQTFWKNVILLGCTILCVLHPFDMLRFISKSNQWIVMNFTALFIFIVSGRALYDLPYFDFRPYHIGTDLRAGWQKMMEGEESPYADFFIERAGGNDITDSLLNLKGYTFLLVSPHLEQADESQFDKINEIFEYAQEHDYPWFGLTASSERYINRWVNATGAEYEFCLTDDIVLKKLDMPLKPKDMSGWHDMVARILKHYDRKVTIAVAGKYVELQDAYISITESLKHAALHNEAELDIRWVNAEKIEATGTDLDKVFAGVNGILVPGGFGDRGIEGKISAVRYAREHKIPFFGICLGMQCAVIEFARNVCGMKDANSSEFRAEVPAVIDLMPDQVDIEDKGGTMRLGLYPCKVYPGTLTDKAYGQPLVYERHRHRYEFNNEYRDVLTEHGLVLGGISPDDRLVEIVELPQSGHPWFLGCQFHPEFKSRPTKAHPLFRDFIAAALQYKK